jgi:hypothetical protein
MRSLIRVTKLSFVAVAALSLSAQTAHAGEFSPGHSPSSYVGSAFASALYFPAKVVFAAVGAVASGIVYVATLGDREPSQEIWTASVEGDYVVTPSMIEGDEDVDFVGG